MRARLAYQQSHLDLEQPVPANAAELERDLELATLFEAMAGGDGYLRDLVGKAFLASLGDADAIRYRQAVLADCLEHPGVVRELYSLAVEGLETKQKVMHFWFRESPDGLLRKSLRILELLVDVLRRLRKVADEHGPGFESAGFRSLFATLQRDLGDTYLAEVEHHRRELEFRRGALISARLGRANRGTHYVLRKPRERGLIERLTPAGSSGYSFTIAARDEHGQRSLEELRNRGIKHAANALAQSVDHILGFFETLRTELGFYVCCLNLHERLTEKGQPTAFPEPQAADQPILAARALYDPSLALELPGRVVTNDVEADGKRLVMITGANQGGKSTFLRSLGVAQLMMQAGMFVAAEAFRASVCTGVFTHFKREEDPTMTSGKLDEELSRMSEIAESIGPNGLLLCNESFASTNEREGAEIARGVVRAMVDADVRVCFVTHLFELGDSLYREELPAALFLRAERKPSGERTFRVVPDRPLPTSYGVDSYQRVFAATASPAGTASAPPL
jgi:MutS domain V